MRNSISLVAVMVLLIAIALGAPSCAKAKEAAPTAAAIVSPPPAVAGGATYPGAVRAEALLRGAKIPFRPRDDLIPREFPEGCEWLAAYSSSDSDVTLEAFAFTDVVKAENYVTNRNADFDVMDVEQEHMIVNNGNLVLVAWFTTTLDGDLNMKRHGDMGAFANAFALGE